ncbi:MAG: CDP-alcohol phosphatidyltransferase family protein [Planctomycetes bacterium]|nr:CDP-alcohol phosphatidyltransferase family protein [Planctomycetota bacterium]
MNEELRHLTVQLITAARVPLAAGAAVCVWLASTMGVWPVVVAAGMLVLLELTDYLDGRLARKWNVAGTFGELFDPYIDSISRMTVFFGLAAAGASSWWLLLVLAIRDVSVAYIRIMSLLTGRAVHSRLSGKLKAGVQGAGAIILTLTLLPPAVFDQIGLPGLIEFIAPARLAVIFVVAAVTAWSAFDYFIGAVRGSASNRKNL